MTTTRSSARVAPNIPEVPNVSTGNIKNEERGVPEHLWGSLSIFRSGGGGDLVAVNSMKVLCFS